MITESDLRDVLDAIELSRGNNYVKTALCEWVNGEMLDVHLGSLIYHHKPKLSRDEIIKEAFRRDAEAAAKPPRDPSPPDTTRYLADTRPRVHPLEDMDEEEMRWIVDVLLAFPNEGIRRALIEIVHEKRPDIDFDDLLGRNPPLTADQIIEEIFGNEPQT